jgi:DNA-binding transcriptional LysR family regulator
MTEDRVHLWQRRARRGGYNHYEETPLQTPIPTLTEFLPEPLSNFVTAHRQVNIDLEERLSDEIVAAVTDGTADVGIVAGSVGLETLPFRTDRFVLVVSPKHRLAGLDIRRNPRFRLCRPRPGDRASTLSCRESGTIRPPPQAVGALTPSAVWLSAMSASGSSPTHRRAPSEEHVHPPDRAGRRMGPPPFDDLHPSRGRPADLRARPRPASGCADRAMAVAQKIQRLSTAYRCVRK